MDQSKSISDVFFKHLGWYNCLIISLLLLIGSVVIALIYAYNNGKKKRVVVTEAASNPSPEDLLSPIVVSFALFSSYVSGNLILKNTDEVHSYGTQCIVKLITFVFVGFNLGYFYIPVYYNLQLSSAFEYLEIRFSRSTRLIISLLAIVQSILFLTMITYKTSEIFGTTLFPGVDRIFICGVVLFIATISCLIACLKSILGTNIFYTIIVFGSLSAITGLGIFKFGGFAELLDTSLNSSRIEFMNFDPDLRVQNTVWTSIIAEYMLLSSFFMTTNCTAQRLISMKTLLQAKLSLILLAFYLILLTILCSIIGLMVSATYSDIAQDDGHMPNDFNFLFPNYVINTFGDFPGIYGLWLTCILCASLSVLTNVLHGLGMTIICDYIEHYFPHATENTLNIVLKVCIFLFGGIVFGNVFLLNIYQPLLRIINGSFLVLIGSIFGLFTLGMFFPFANSKGALLGVLASVSSMSFLIWGSQKHPQTNFHESNIVEKSNSTVSMFSHGECTNDIVPVLLPEDQLLTNLISILQVWYPALSCLITMASGLLFSFIILRWTKKWKVSEECLSPIVLRMWVKLFPTSIKSWIEPDDDLLFLCSGAFQFTPKDNDDDFRVKKESLCQVQIQPYYI